MSFKEFKDITVKAAKEGHHAVWDGFFDPIIWLYRFLFRKNK